MTSGGNNFIHLPHQGCQLESWGFTPLEGVCIKATSGWVSTWARGFTPPRGSA